MTEIEQAEHEVIEEFQFFDNWMDRYQYLIDLGRKLPPFPEEWKTEEYPVARLPVPGLAEDQRAG